MFFSIDFNFTTKFLPIKMYQLSIMYLFFYYLFLKFLESMPNIWNSSFVVLFIMYISILMILLIENSYINVCDIESREKFQDKENSEMFLCAILWSRTSTCSCTADCMVFVMPSVAWHERYSFGGVAAYTDL